MRQDSVSNLILKRLSESDFEILAPHLDLVQVKTGQDLILPGVPIEHVYFFESGIAATLVAISGSEPIEIGVIGREGVTDHVLEVGDSSALRCSMQLQGSAYVVSTERYVEWIRQRPSALQTILRYQQAMNVQASFTALAHGSFTIEERLARWLLMCFDRHDSNDLPFVHESLAMMLAVRRAGVTRAMHTLEGQGAIKATRANIKLRDRAILESMTGGSYGPAEAEYIRLLSRIPNA